MIRILCTASIARESRNVEAFRKCTLSPEMVRFLDITVSASGQGTGYFNFFTLARNLQICCNLAVAAIPHFDQSLAHFSLSKMSLPETFFPNMEFLPFADRAATFFVSMASFRLLVHDSFHYFHTVWGQCFQEKPQVVVKGSDVLACRWVVSPPETATLAAWCTH